MFDRKRQLVSLTTIVATLSICAVLVAEEAKSTTPVTAVVAEAGGEGQEDAAKAKTQEQLVAELKRANPEFDGQLNVKLNKEGGIIDVKFDEKGSVADLTPLKGLPLGGLKLPACKKIVDLSPLSGMPLKRLYMAGTGVTDLTPLKGLPLVSLVISSEVSDLGPLKGMRLEDFGGMHNKVLSDLAPLKDMSLSSLRLYDCSKVKDITPLRNAKLKTINIERTSVADLSPLRGQPLKEANLCSGLIADISPLEGMSPRYIDLTCNKNIKDISVVKDMKDLEDLRLDDTGISDLSPIKGMEKLRVLSILRCPNITDLSVIKDMNIEAFVFDPTKFSQEQIAIIRSMKSLKWVSNSWNQWNNGYSYNKQPLFPFTAEDFWKR